MNRLILSSVAVAALTLSATTVSAQLSSEQRSAVRIVIVERLTDEMQNRLPGRIAEAAAALGTLTPEQRERSAAPSGRDSGMTSARDFRSG